MPEKDLPHRPVVAFAMGSAALRESLFLPDILARLHAAAEVVDSPVLTEFDSPQAREVLGRVDALITGWGCPRVTPEVLDAAPRLRLIAHAAGTVKSHLDPQCWSRGITVTTAAQANARPVAEYTLAAIIMAGKDTFLAAHRLRGDGWASGRDREPAKVGNYRTTIGIIGASRIGRLVLELLRSFSFRVLLADPTVSADEAAALGTELVGLDELMARSRIVSLHAPILPSTIGMIGRSQLARMADGSTFINTARGILVDHDALRGEAVSGRLSLILDVTDPEPLPSDDPLLHLPNVLLTPHLAGSIGNELPAMADLAVTEVEHLATGSPYAHPVSTRELAAMA